MKTRDFAFLDFTDKNMLKAAGIAGAVTSVKVKPNLLQDLQKAVPIGRHQIRLLFVTVAVAKLHGRRFEDSPEEALDFRSFRMRHDFVHARLGRIVVQQAHKGGVGGATEDGLVQVVKEGILRLVFLPVGFLAL